MRREPSNQDAQAAAGYLSYLEELFENQDKQNPSSFEERLKMRQEVESQHKNEGTIKPSNDKSAGEWPAKLDIDFENLEKTLKRWAAEAENDGEALLDGPAPDPAKNPEEWRAYWMEFVEKRHASVGKLYKDTNAQFDYIKREVSMAKPADVKKSFGGKDDTEAAPNKFEQELR